LTIFDCTNFIIRQYNVSIPRDLLQASITIHVHACTKRLLKYKTGRLLDTWLRKFVMGTAYKSIQ